MTADLKEAARLTHAALVCLQDAIARQEKADTPSHPRARDFATLADDAALSAAWRLADAGLLLRRHLEPKGLQAVGLTEPTGRRVTLPRVEGRPMIFNCLPEGETLADLARRDHLQGFDVAFSKADPAYPDDRATIDCPPPEAEFATIYGRNDLGEAIAIHDVDLTNAGADSLAQACREVFAAIIAASRITEIH